MRMRQHYEAALCEWSLAVADLQTALADFTGDGQQTAGGTWLLTMSQTKAATLDAARRRADAAQSALDRILDDLLMPQVPRQ